MKYITKGNYGAVFKPGRKNNKKDHEPNTITKIFYCKKEWTNEINKFNQIILIDKLSYFTPKRIITEKIIPSEHFNKEIFEKAGSDWDYNKENWQIIYEDCGINLNNAKITINKLIYSIQPVFYGITKLVENNLIHQDIKPANLVYNLKINLTKIIDFGLLVENEHVYDEDTNLIDNDYYYFPPEFNIFNIIQKNKSIDNNLLDIIIKNNYEIFKSKYIFFFNKIFSKDFLDNQIKEFTDFINDIIKNYSYINIREYFELFANKIDIYMLGITLLEVIFRNKNINYNNIPTDFLDLIMKMITLNPIKRISANDALKIYIKLIYY